MLWDSINDYAQFVWPTVTHTLLYNHGHPDGRGHFDIAWLAVRSLLLTQDKGTIVIERTYQQIAEELVISINTVRTHVSHLYRKLGVRRRDQAVAEAKRLGLFAAMKYA